MRKNIGILLMVLGIALGIYGFTKLDDNKADIRIGDLELSAEDKGGMNQAYILLGLGALGLLAGAVAVSKR
ncbi:MAG: hypothetical protein H6562_10800 [Lewinellaceae bacterium]|nr:hypothetical protein [Lewinella sp.]MCB9279396.1 hypothetical protein [Lewinellaceae bacterium]